MEIELIMSGCCAVQVVKKLEIGSPKFEFEGADVDMDQNLGCLCL
jgi:hypothetical protein